MCKTNNGVRLTLIALLALYAPGLVCMPSYANTHSCARYLINRDELTRILAQNLKDSPLHSPSVTTSSDGPCRIRLEAILEISGNKQMVVGCTNPLHQGHSLGLSEIKLYEPISITIPSSSVDISDHIRKHCGELYPIIDLQTTKEGVWLYFAKPKVR